MAGHAEVKDQCIAAVGVDQPVFGSAAKLGHPRAREPLAKVDRESAAEIGAARLDARQPTPAKNPGEAADRRFNFGKLGHRADMAKGSQAR
jgi:hypothetical protein